MSAPVTTKRPTGKFRAFPKGRQIDAAATAEIRDLLGNRPRRADLLVEHLHMIQDKHGHISARHLAALAGEMKLSQAEVYEVATFYAHFDVIKENETPPPPLTVRVCDGVACQLAGAGKLLKALRDSPDENVRIVGAPCMGACDSAPAAMVGKNRIGSADTDRVAAAIEANSTAPATTGHRDLEAYLEAGGYRLLKSCLAGERDREEVLLEIEKSGLRGLGGAGFPVARKWRFMLDAPKPRLMAINADEGEPGTFKDRHCLETDPHRVIEGALLAAWIIEAEEIYIYLRDEYPHIRRILESEIADVTAAGFGEGVTIHLRRGAGAYVCGEESALLESLEGKRGLPRNRPPYPAQAGLFGRPTLINNVESLYWLRQIVEDGAEAYQKAGRPHFYSVSGRVRNPGVKLAPAGITVARLIDDYSGGMADDHTLKAYLPGGASGGILPASMADLRLDFGTLEEYGCFVGSAAVVVLSDRDDIRAVVRNLVRFFEDESCGQCTPCRVGCEKLSMLLAEPDWNEDLIVDLAEAMREASICGLGQAAANPVVSALRFLKDGMA